MPNLNTQPKNKKMKKLIIVLVAASFGLSSCSKEVKLENRLDGKWKIDSYDMTSTTVKTFTSSSSAYKDSSLTTNYPDLLTTIKTEGDVDFVSDNKLVMFTSQDISTTTTVENITSTQTINSENEQVSEYYVSGEDEITIVTSDSDEETYQVYEVSTNEKDSQVWEYTDVSTNTEPTEGGVTTTVITTNVKMTLSLVK